MTHRLYASYRAVSVPYQLGSSTSHTLMYDAAIRLGTDIVWHEARPHGNLCLTPGGALQRAKKILARVETWEAA